MISKSRQRSRLDFFKKIIYNMSIKEKLAKEDGTHIYCYKQGAFWV
jgi:hypothetical protein